MQGDQGVDSCRRKQGLVVLDVIGTLVHSSRSKVVSEGEVLQHDFEMNGTYYYFRPDIEEFLQFCFDHFDVMVWSSRESKNVVPLVPKIFSEDRYPVLTYSRSECAVAPERGEYATIKDLSRVWKTRIARDRGWTPDNTIAIDDDSYKYYKNKANCLTIKPYSPIVGEADKEFQRLIRKMSRMFLISPSKRPQCSTPCEEDEMLGRSLGGSRTVLPGKKQMLIHVDLGLITPLSSK